MILSDPQFNISNSYVEVAAELGVNSQPSKVNTLLSSGYQFFSKFVHEFTSIMHQ